MPQLTLLDIAIANHADPVVGLIEESIRSHPEMQFGAARTIDGTKYETWVRTAIPNVGFRKANQGTASVKSTWENRVVECFIIDGKIQVDRAVADGFVDGAPAMLALEAIGVMEGANRNICQQFYYGVSNDALGFPGIQNAVDASMTVDATGTTSGSAFSVYAVRFGDHDLRWVWGNNGALTMSGTRIQDVPDPNNSALTYEAYIDHLYSRVGLQVGRKQSVACIKNLTDENGKGLTDVLLSKLLEVFPVGYPPDCFLMSRHARGQLQRSRTTFNPAGKPAPLPTEYEGIPIYATDSLLLTEAVR